MAKSWRHSDVNVDRADVERALAQFVGEIQQVPPMYSAIKRDGQKLYDLARQGIEIEREARAVIIHSIELRDYQAPDVDHRRALLGGHLHPIDRARSGRGAGHGRSFDRH